MLNLRAAESLPPLAEDLGQRLADAPADAFTQEWIAVPAAGIKRWLQLELARTLGASEPGANDGVVANIKFAYPATLGQAVLAADPLFIKESGDPWSVDRLTWAVLAALDESSKWSTATTLSELTEGASRYGRARYVADLFDSYSNHRPEMIRAWVEGRNVDGNGSPLDAAMAWQPELWRVTREIVGSPSSPERMPQLLADLRTNALEVDLPPRVSLFGITGMPGGEQFLELISALGQHREVNIYLLEPSVGALKAIQKHSSSPLPIPRNQEVALEELAHPLLRSWGQPARERAVLLSNYAGIPEVQSLTTTPPTQPEDLLHQLQGDLRTNTAPQSNFSLLPSDRSVEIHSCHGLTRQVEVLHDALVHALADDPTLTQDEILVACPTLSQYAPLIEATFSSRGESATNNENFGPRLFAQIADRSQREVYPVLDCLSALIDLIGGRFGASEVTEFLRLGPVRDRFKLTDPDFSRLDTWVKDTNVLWGIDATQRQRWGIPETITTNTWQSGLDQLLLGVMVRNSNLELGPGGVAPYESSSDAPEIVGRVADALEMLRRLAAEADKSQTAAQWCDLLAKAANDFFRGPVDKEQLDLDWLLKEITEISAAAVVGVDAQPSTTLLGLNDIKRLLADLLKGVASRPDFFRGAITFSTLTPLRGVPFRVVAVLGLDEGALASPATTGDDLATRAARIGDRDARADGRQSLLEVILSARDRVIITHSGSDVRTNQKTPDAVVLAELRDTINATLVDNQKSGQDDDAWEHIITVHPRQKTDARNFTAGELGLTTSWGFDAAACAGANARATFAKTSSGSGGGNHSDEYLTVPITPLAAEAKIILLSDLKKFLKSPVEWFFTQGLQVRLRQEDEVESDEFATTINALEKYKIGKRLLTARSAGVDDRVWRKVELAKGTVPPGPYGTTALDALAREVEEFMEVIEQAGIDPTSTERIAIDLVLPDQTRIVGSIHSGANSGSLAIEFSRVKPPQHLNAALDLMLLTATDPNTDWRAINLRRGTKNPNSKKNSPEPPPDLLELVAAQSDPNSKKAAAEKSLAVIVDCFRRGTCEPLPLFGLSQKLAKGETPKDKEWRDDFSHVEGDEPIYEEVFGDKEFSELLKIPARPGDPEGRDPSRARRYAKYLWGAVDEFCSASTPAEVTP